MVQAWAEGLGCSPQLVGEPGVHLVPGGALLRGLDGVYLARIGPSVFVFCPAPLQSRAAEITAAIPTADVFTAATCARIAGVPEQGVHGPSWHGFVDAAHFTATGPPAGRRLRRDDPMLAEMQAGCGDADWAEGGFGDPAGVLYGIEEGGRLVAAGNLTPFRSRPADVGLLTRRSARGRGLAKQVAVRMIQDWLPAVGLMRYRALIANEPSLAIARGMGFAEYGQNFIARLSHIG